MYTLVWGAILFGGYIFFTSDKTSSNVSFSSRYFDSTEYSSEEESNTISYEDAISDNWDEIRDYIDATETIEACSDSNGNCYDLEADISEGCIDTIYFDNGGYLNFYSACFNEDGYTYDSDENGDDWEFNLDMGSSLVTEAIDEWASESDL